MLRRAVVVVLLIAAACSSDKQAAGPTTTATSSSSASSTGLAPPTLPEGCTEATPSQTDVVTFVAGGRVWAMDPTDRDSVKCLFSTDDAGLFSWGPQGDRVLLTGLEVRGFAGAPSRPAANLRPTYFSWSRPTGTTVVFTDAQRGTLARADMGGAGARDITPLPDKKFGDIAYHPSGLAIGFVVTDADGFSAIYMSTNQGTNAELLVQGQDPETKFEHIVFARDGVSLYYTIDRGDGTHEVGTYSLDSGVLAETISFDAPVRDVVEAGNTGLLAFTVGGSCVESRVVVDGVTLEAGGLVPESVMGRLDENRIVIARGGCGAPTDVLLVDKNKSEPVVLATSVTAAAMRTPEPMPPPPLPDRLPRSGFA